MPSPPEPPAIQAIQVARQPLSQPHSVRQHPPRQLQSLEASTLLDVARAASDELTRQAVHAIGTLCHQEMATFCAAEAALVDATYGFTNQDVLAPVFVAALRQTHQCLARQESNLGLPCVDAMRSALGGAMVFSGRAQEPNPEWTGQPPLPPVHSPSRETKAKGKGSVRRHHHQQHQREQIDDSSEPELARLKVYLLHSGLVSAPARDKMLADWGHHYRHHQSNRHGVDHAHEGPAAWLYVVLLPFFCVGVVVSIQFVIRYVKQRQSPPRAAVASAEYAPLRTADSLDE